MEQLNKLLEKGFGKPNLSKSHIAKICGVQVMTVQLWFKRGYIPAQYAPKLELALNIPVEELNPKVFTKEWSTYRHGG
tara:strand:- start:492 stop:725 length:234 start_codon:yes stop_codon:yes gene_type:complete